MSKRICQATDQLSLSGKMDPRARASWYWTIAQSCHDRIIWLLVGTLALLFAGFMCRPLYAQQVDGLQAAVAIEKVLIKAIERCEPSVVAIARVKKSDTEPKRQPGGNRPKPIEKPPDADFIPNEFGTGVIVDRRGLILTHYDVVNSNSIYWVTTHDRKVYKAKILASDPRGRLAILELDKPVAGSLFKPITFGDTSKLRKGNIALVLGNPYAIARDGQASASWGIISNLTRKAGPMPADDPRDRRSTLHHFGTLIQTDAKLNLGTSGGPLLNLKGEMIGLVTSMAAAAGYEQSAGYAIAVDKTFHRVMETLKQGREVEYGLLGVSLINLAPEEIHSGRFGVRVRRVFKGTPAQSAGLKPDDLITHINNKPVVNADQLHLYLGQKPVEAVVQLTFDRPNDSKGVRKIQVKLSKFPVRGEKIVTAPRPTWRGVRVDYATALPDFSSQLRNIDIKGCIAIIEVEKGSPAWQGGLRPNMFINFVEDHRVTTPKQFYAAVAGKRGVVMVQSHQRFEQKHSIKPKSG